MLDVIWFNNLVFFVAVFFVFINDWSWLILIFILECNIVKFFVNVLVFFFKFSDFLVEIDVFLVFGCYIFIGIIVNFLFFDWGCLVFIGDFLE